MPFDSAYKFMATLNEASGGSRAILVEGTRPPARTLAHPARRRRLRKPLDIAFWEAAIGV
ncbi:MAG: hypothetical protein R2692_03680 [Microbacterium sp.]